MTLRSFLFWPHLVAGLTAGLVILLMSVTGVLLTYERQLIAWSDSHFRSTVPAGEAATVRLPSTALGPGPSTRLGPGMADTTSMVRPKPDAAFADATLEEIVERVRAARPDATFTTVTVKSAADAPVAFATGERTLYADAYTGAVLGESTTGMRELMSQLRAWHRWLAMEGDQRATARAITGWANVLFAMLALTGLYLWMPRTWSWAHVKAVLLFRRTSSGKARDFNWHNVIGFWSAIPLLIVVVSAIPISFPWATAMVYRAYGEEPPAPRGGGPGGGPRGGGPAARASGEAVAVAGLTMSGGVPFDALLARAAAQEPGWQSISFRLPGPDDATVAFAIDRGDGGQPHLRSTATVDRMTGDMAQIETFATQTPARRMRSIMRFAHTGEVLGLAGQTIAGLVTAGSTVLVWTGFALAWRRFRAWVARRSHRPAESIEAIARSVAGARSVRVGPDQRQSG